MKVIGISFAIAMLIATGVVAAFTMNDEQPLVDPPTAPPTLQPRATRPATQIPTRQSSAAPATPTTQAGTSEPAFEGASGDRTMGRAIAEPESTGGTLVIGVIAPPASLNPLLAGDLPADSILHAIFEPLVEPHPDTLEPVGVLAQSWSVDQRGTTWTFRLRDGVRWHDGQSLTAGDVVFSLEHYLDPETGHPVSARLGSIVTGIQSEDPSTVVVTTSEAFADLPVVLGVLPVVPRHVLAEVPLARLPEHPSSTGELRDAVIGTGPFRFVSRADDGTITTEAHIEYWDGEPALAGIVARPVTAQAEMIELLRAVEIDVGTLSSGAASAFDGLPVRVVDYPLNGFTMLGFNLNQNTTPLFQDARVRQALLLALDRESLVREARAGYGDIPPGTLPVNSWAARPDDIAATYPYDPARARELLDEAGWTTGVAGVRSREGRTLSIRLVTNSENSIRAAYLELIREQWEAIGVEVELVVEPFADIEARLAESGDFDAFLSGYSWGLSPDQAPLWSCAGGRPAANFTGYCNRAVDNLLVRARRELDPDLRAELYLEIQNLVLADLPVAILDFPRGLTGVISRAHNIYPNAVNFYFNAETWWLE